MKGKRGGVGGGFSVCWFVLMLVLFGGEVYLFNFLSKEIFLFLGGREPNCCFPLKYKFCTVYVVNVQC